MKALAVSLLLFAGCASQRWHKEGGSAVQFQWDAVNCKDESEKNPTRSPLTGLTWSPDNLAWRFVDELREPAQFRACMERRGWKLVSKGEPGYREGFVLDD